jgi:hypothetical protein
VKWKKLKGTCKGDIFGKVKDVGIIYYDFSRQEFDNVWEALMIYGR